VRLFYIVHECPRPNSAIKKSGQVQKKPDYGRVLISVPKPLQQELIGPGFLAIMAPMLVGFSLRPICTGGFLAGMILVGQLLAVFMANAGGRMG